MNNDFNTVVKLPYPQIKVNKKDIGLAYRLLNSYAGNVSEFSAVSQYSFQSIYLNEYNELSKIIEEISITEMRHLKILGELIELLGLTPYFVTYKDNLPIPWNSDFVDFTTNYRDMLVNDIKIEKEAIEEYRSIIEITDDINIKKILERIILDEDRHIEIFSRLLVQYDNQ